MDSSLQSGNGPASPNASVQLGEVVRLPHSRTPVVARFLHGGYYVQRMLASKEILEELYDGVRVKSVERLDEGSTAYTECEGGVVTLHAHESLNNVLFPVEQFERELVQKTTT